MSQQPLPRSAAAAAVGRCIWRSTLMLAGGSVHLPREWVERRIRFSDGTTGRVYRETSVDAVHHLDPCVLEVAFRLRAARGFAHTLFEWESLLNTPLFVGFPGFRTKLWVAHDERGTYRGIYEWDGARRAESYARALWRLLELVSVPGSIRYTVLPGLRRADLFPESPTSPVLAGVDGQAPEAAAAETGTWWQVLGYT